MPNIGPIELAIVAIIALVVFGPKRLPELGRSLGRGLREFRQSVGGKGPAAPATIAGEAPESAEDEVASEGRG